MRRQLCDTHAVVRFHTDGRVTVMWANSPEEATHKAQWSANLESVTYAYVTEASACYANLAAIAHMGSPDAVRSQ